MNVSASKLILYGICCLGGIILTFIYYGEFPLITNTNSIELNDNSTHSLFGNKVCSQEHRKTFIGEMCAKSREPPNHMHPRFVLDKPKGILMCEISKSGCTSLKSFWLTAKNNKFSSLGDAAVHSESNLIAAGLAYGFKWNDSYHKYDKFVVVRHPLDRLLSAYYNIVNFKPGDPGPSYTSNDILEHCGLQPPGNASQISFAQFVEYITDPKVKFYNDRHWIPYTDTCFICKVKYDHIFRLETLSAEFDMFKETIGASQQLSMEIPSNNVHHRPQYRTVRLEEYKDLPLSLIYKVLDRYKNDMLMFGYGFDLDNCATICDMDGCC